MEFFVFVVDAGQSTNSGRTTGTDVYEEFEAATKRRVPPSKELCLLKIDELWAKLKGANEEIVMLKAEVKQKDEELSVKENKLRGYAMRNVDLERKLQQQQQGNFKAFLIDVNDVIKKIICNARFQLPEFCWIRCWWI